MEMRKNLKFANSLPFGPKKTSNFRNNLVNFLCAIENFSPARSEVIFLTTTFPALSLQNNHQRLSLNIPIGCWKAWFQIWAKMCYANDTAAAANSWL